MKLIVLCFIILACTVTCDDSFWNSAWELTPAADNDASCCMWEPIVSMDKISTDIWIEAYFPATEVCKTANLEGKHSGKPTAGDKLEYHTILNEAGFVITKNGDHADVVETLKSGKVCKGTLKKSTIDFSGVWTITPKDKDATKNCYLAKPLTVKKDGDKFKASSTWEDSQGCKDLQYSGDFDSSTLVTGNELKFNFIKEYAGTKTFAAFKLYKWTSETKVNFWQKFGSEWDGTAAWEKLPSSGPGGLGTLGWVLIILLIIAIVAGVGYFFYRRQQAAKLNSQYGYNQSLTA